MHRLIITLLTLPIYLLNINKATAHCQMPCGIYHDNLVFRQIKENQTTIAKAMKSITDLSKKETKSVQDRQQLMRWVYQKELHATNIQERIANYFFAQRLKIPTNAKNTKKYVQKLKQIHLVTVLAMQCKQTVNLKTANNLLNAIKETQKLFHGKKTNKKKFNQQGKKS